MQQQHVAGSYLRLNSNSSGQCQWVRIFKCLQQMRRHLDQPDEKELWRQKG